jgi:hypothetical protein
MRWVLALLALAASGCERTSLTLSLGLDREDSAAQAWLGYYPSKFEPVGQCPTEAVFEAQAVAADKVDEAAKRLREVFAVELKFGEATQLTGKPPPKPDPASQRAIQAEAQIAQAEAQLAEQDAFFAPGLDAKQAQHALAVARKAAREAGAFGGGAGQRPYLVRGVSFSPTRDPKVTVCYGDVQVSDQQLGSAVPKMFLYPMVVWVATPVRRGRVIAGVTQ